MKLLGTILMWLGFLSGALATVFNLPSAGVEFVKNLKPDDAVRFDLQDLSGVEVPQDNWDLIPWTWFGLSFLVCAVGVVLIRMSLSRTADHTSHKVATDLESIRANLANLVANSTKLGTEINKMAPSKITAFIDDELADDFRAFADGRESMIPRFGLNTYADIMSHFAAGERYANRAWSAAADGYVDEAATSLHHAIDYLKSAADELDKAGKHGS